jgi:FtsH-binding integral membrane protein
MKPIDTRLLTAGILFILTIASGIWVSRAGRPLNAAVLTVHKLISLATVILLVTVIMGMSKGIPMTGAVIAAIAITAVFFLGLFATGVILSFDKPVNHIIKIIHAALPLLAAALVFVSVYLLTARK